MPNTGPRQATFLRRRPLRPDGELFCAYSIQSFCPPVNARRIAPPPGNARVAQPHGEIPSVNIFTRLTKHTPRSHQARLVPKGLTIEVERKETLLAALLRNDIKAPHDCQVGSCTKCKCRILEGKVKELLDSAYVLDKEDLDNGYVLACQSIPKTDIVFTYNKPA